MTVSRGPDERVVLPRWRRWRTSESQGEQGALKSGDRAFDQVTTSEDAQRELQARLREFHDQGGFHHAADVVATAVVLGLEGEAGIHEAASAIQEAPTPVVRAISERIIKGIPPQGNDVRSEWADDEKLRSWIAKQKQIVRDQPRNALAWTDLALAHTVLGQVDSAEHAICIALDQASGNRFILRVAARFYIHLEDVTRANDILTRDLERLRADPWLLAAQIAIADASDLPQLFASHARRLLDRGFEPHDRSELASALATIEIKSGKVKKARKLLSEALVDPTDNTLAQAEWSAQQGIYVAGGDHFDVPRNYEAMARYHYRNEEFDSALTFAGRWLADQPFALDPALFTSFVAATLVDNQAIAIRACEIGLRANRNNPILLNNLAFSLANSGQVSEAAAVIERSVADISQMDSAMMNATRGLIAFRSGDIDKGRALYRQAVDSLIREKQLVAAASASLFWVYEELHSGSSGLEEALAFAESINRVAGRGPEIILTRRRLARLAEDGTSASQRVVLILGL